MSENIAVCALLRNEEGNHLKVCKTTKLERLVPGMKNCPVQMTSKGSLATNPKKEGLCSPRYLISAYNFDKASSNDKVIPPKVSKSFFRLGIWDICNITSFVTCLFVSGLPGRFLMCGFLQNPSNRFAGFIRRHMLSIFLSVFFRNPEASQGEREFALAIWSKRRNSSAAREAAASPGHAEN